MVSTILMAVSKWAVNNLGVEDALKNVGTDVLDKVLWSPLKNKIIGFFEKEEEADQFIKEISEREVVNEHKPSRDIEDVYEEIRGISPEKELFDVIVKFFADSPNIIKEANNESKVKGNGYTVIQNANRDIINIKKVKRAIFKNH